MTIPVSRLVTRDPVTLPRSSTILEAAVLMARHTIGLVVLTEAEGSRKVAGVVSERDIIRAVAGGADLGASAESIATRRVVQVRESARVAEAARLMREHRIRHVVVVDAAGELKGVVSMRDLMGEAHTLRAIAGFESEEYPPATD